MSGTEIALVVAELVGGILAKATAGTWLSEQAKGWLKSKAEQDAFQRAIEKAYQDFGNEYADLTASLFDKHFIENSLAQELSCFFSRTDRPSASRIAVAYKKQFLTSPNVEVAAARFVALVEQHMGAEPALQSLVDHRQLDELRRDVGALQPLLARIEQQTAPDAMQSQVSAATSRPADSIEALRRASVELLSWPQTLGNNYWIDRPELATLIERTRDNAESLTLLLGDLGSGKSALLARFGNECLENGYAVFAIKADQVPETVSSLEDLREAYELTQPILSTLGTRAVEKRTILLIDQLDALGELVDLKTQRLNILLRLVRAAQRIPNLHVVCSCRAFERKYDVHLSRLEAEELYLSLPAWPSIQSVLGTYGVNGDSWPLGFREMLRTPQWLKLFLQHFSGPGEMPVFESYHRMLEQLFADHLLRRHEHQRAGQLLLRIASEMSDDETLFAPVARYDADRSSLEYLTSIGFLKLDEVKHRITFTHQTIFDFARSRAFIAGAGSLSDFVLKRQTGLFVRPKLWSALAYLRASDERVYQRELKAIWSSPDLRTHLRILLIEFLGLQEEPMEFERHLLRPLFSDKQYATKTLHAIAGRRVWFEIVKESQLPAIMQLPVAGAWPACAVLQQAWQFDQETVLHLISRYWVPIREKHHLAWYALRELSKWTPGALDAAISIAMTGEVADAAVCDLACVISQSAPDLAPRFLGPYISKKLDAADAERKKEATAPATGSDDSSVAKEIKRRLRDPIRSVLESTTEFYGIHAVAEAAPKAYLEQLWRPICKAVGALSYEESKIRNQYRDDHLIASHLEVGDGSDPRFEYPVLESIVVAITEFAKQDATGFTRFVTDNQNSELSFVHRNIALGLCELAKTDHVFAFDYLLEDPRRMNIGSFQEDERYAKLLIRAVTPFLSDAEMLRLERAILAASQYRPDLVEPDPKARFERQKWDRMFRLRLLLQCPQERLSKPTQEHIRMELESNFPTFKDERRDPRMIQTTSSMSADQMSKASDDALMKFLGEYPDETEWGGFGRRGGSIEVSRAFAEFAKASLPRAIKLVNRLDPKTHQRPAGYMLEGIDKDAVPAEELFTLIEDLDAKGFTGGEFRGQAASALRKRVVSGPGLPDKVISLLSRWLSEFVPEGKEVRESSSKEKEDQGDSLLWGYGRTRILPHGTYPVLNALLWGLIARDAVPNAALFGVLSAHLKRGDREEIWEAIAFDLSLNIARCDRAKAQAFLTELFQAYPTLLADIAGVWLVAHTLSWANPEVLKGWLTAIRSTPWHKARQAYGELLGLAAVVIPTIEWPKKGVQDVLERHQSNNAEVVEEMLGLVHAAVGLWKESSEETGMVQVLLAGLRSQNALVGRAAMDFYRRNQTLSLNDITRSVVQATIDGKAIETVRSHGFLLEVAAELLDEDPALVNRICCRILDSSGADLGNFASAAVLDSEGFIAIAMSLQRLSEPHRTNGISLFERLIEHDAYRAREVLMDVDRRPGHSAPPRQSARRRRSKH